MKLLCFFSFKEEIPDKQENYFKWWLVAIHLSNNGNNISDPLNSTQVSYYKKSKLAVKEYYHKRDN